MPALHAIAVHSDIQFPKQWCMNYGWTLFDNNAIHAVGAQDDNPETVHQHLLPWLRRLQS